ncbi:MAG TPA: hypothetical protein VN825_02980 [Candidatus Acidoferrum sp.]|nr:hypothetical protein [Candidatus Acidoferrum sp.]
MESFATFEELPAITAQLLGFSQRKPIIHRFIPGSDPDPWIVARHMPQQMKNAFTSGMLLVKSLPK